MVSFSDLTLIQLRKIAKAYNIHSKIPRYSTLKKDQLIEHMNKHLSIGNDDVIKIKGDDKTFNIPILESKKPKEPKAKKEKAKKEKAKKEKAKKEKAPKEKTKKEKVKKTEPKKEELKKEEPKKEEPNYDELYNKLNEEIEQLDKEEKYIKKNMQQIIDKRLFNEIKDKKVSNKQFLEMRKQIANQLLDEHSELSNKRTELIMELEKIDSKRPKEVIQFVKKPTSQAMLAIINGVSQETMGKEITTFDKLLENKKPATKPVIKKAVEKVVEKIVEEVVEKVLSPKEQLDKLKEEKTYIKDREEGMVTSEVKKLMDQYRGSISVKELYKMAQDNFDKKLADITKKIKELEPLAKKEKKNKKVGEGLAHWTLHAVVIPNSVKLQDAEKIAHDFIHKKKFFHRDTKQSHRFRNLPKSKFVPRSFRTKKINEKVSLIYGRLKPEFHHLDKIGKGIFDFFSKPDKYNDKSQNTLNQYGNEKIISMKIYRAPVKSYVNLLMNLITQGKFNELKNYDKFYHLGLLCKLANGKEIIIEKNETINISDSFSPDNGAEYMPVELNGKQLTLNQLLENAKSHWNPSYTYYEYNAFSNNCQVFVLRILLGSGLLTNTNKVFIYQDVKELAQKLPNQGIINTFTDIGAVVSQAKGGKLGRKKEIIL